MFATIYLPDFYLQAAMRHQPELRTRPVALIDPAQTKVSIIQLNEIAGREGIVPGMTPSQALARCLQVVIKIRERVRENVIAEILLQHAFTLSPHVEATAPGICTVQFTDNRNLVPKLHRVVDQLQACEIIAQSGVAPNPDTSLLAAHLASPILEIPEPGEYLAPLPIETLAIGY